MALTLTEDERAELERRVRSRKIRAEDARRAHVILMLAAGESFTTIMTTVGCYPDYVGRWKQRFETERLAGLRAKYRGQPATVRTPAMEARILAKTRQRPPDGRIGARGSWRRPSASVTCWSLAYGAAPVGNRIDSSDTCCPMIPPSRRKPRT